MNIIQKVNGTIVENGGIAKTSDFIAQGINAKDIIELCNEGYITRIRQGYYRLAGDSYSSEEQMIKTLIPEGVVCMESALFHYGYSDFTPRKWAIADLQGFPCGSAGEESAYNVGDLGWEDPQLGKIPWRRERLLTPVLLLGE